MEARRAGADGGYDGHVARFKGGTEALQSRAWVSRTWTVVLALRLSLRALGSTGSSRDEEGGGGGTHVIRDGLGKVELHDL
jgi:hypothetical protein